MSDVDTFGRLLLCLIAIVGIVFVGGWAVMVSVGVLHHEWWSFVPPMAYWTAVTVVAVSTTAAILAQIVASLIKEFVQ